MVVNN